MPSVPNPLRISEKTKGTIKSIFAIGSPIAFVISLAADIITVTDKYDYIIKPVMFVAALFVLGFSFYYIHIIKTTNKIFQQNEEYEKKIQLVEKEICEGKRILSNHATVKVDVKKKKYIFEFTKEYIIISERTKWFAAQFYCNKVLTDANESKKYYDENQVTWETLNIKASMKYMNADDNETEYNAPVDVLVKRVAEGNNFKQFHIEYKTVEGDLLPIKMGTKIEITYSYEVPVQWWGSYLNRYISYFRESAYITIACTEKGKLTKNDLKLFRCNENGEPAIEPHAIWKEGRVQDYYSRTIELDTTKTGKYVVNWDANEFFGETNLNTPMGPDESQLTRY